MENGGGGGRERKLLVERGDGMGMEPENINASQDQVLSFPEHVK
jgi:hypothetical protein